MQHLWLKMFTKKHFGCTCNICNYVCYQKSDTKLHALSIHKWYKSFKRKKKFNCNICDWRFSWNRSWIDMLHWFMKGKNHLNVTSVHEWYKPFKCHICDYKCSRKNTLDAHVTPVHEGKKKQRQRNGSYQSQKKF